MSFLMLRAAQTTFSTFTRQTVRQVLKRNPSLTRSNQFEVKTHFFLVVFLSSHLYNKLNKMLVQQRGMMAKLQTSDGSYRNQVEVSVLDIFNGAFLHL